ncbi:MAG: GxxExxY protein [Bythopirellula sp.]|nr:GxxExxY protein [Bythopirellula sp.]
MQEELLYGDVTDAIIKQYYHVYNTLGYGFLEKVYENALRVALTKNGFDVKQQSPIQVIFEEEMVGDYYADLLVNDEVILEIKAADSIALKHEAQIINYLKATGVRVGLLLNFGPKAEFRRKIFTKK